MENFFIYPLKINEIELSICMLFTNFKHKYNSFSMFFSLSELVQPETTDLIKLSAILFEIFDNLSVYNLKVFVSTYILDFIFVQIITSITPAV